ncbi:MAG TPA: hypothetical protein VF483_07790 [Gemmatimonadaceae bacterium]
MTEPIPFKPEKPVEKPTDPGEKALRKLEKLEAEHGLLGPADRYKALVNGVKAAQDLIELGDKKARFALVIMSVLNAVAVLLVVRGGEGAIPKKGVWAVVVAIELAVYAILTIYFVSQALSALRPRGVTPPPLASLPSTVTPGTSMRVLFYADIIARDPAEYRRLWGNIRMDNLTTELADQLYVLSTINRVKFAALDRLYVGLTVMAVMLAILITTMGLHRIWG